MRVIVQAMGLMCFFSVASAGDYDYTLFEEDFVSAIVKVRISYADPALAGHCTGTLIAPDVVLTARHCIENAYIQRVTFGSGLSRREVAVVKASFRGTPGQSVNNIKNPDGSYSDFFLHHNAQAQARDALLLFLAEKVTDIEPLPLLPPWAFNYSVYSNPVQVVGYPANSPIKDADGDYAPVSLGPCRLEYTRGWWGQVLKTDCTVHGGNSGGPLIFRINHQPYILGVISTGELHDGRAVNMADRGLYDWIQGEIKNR